MEKIAAALETVLAQQNLVNIGRINTRLDAIDARLEQLLKRGRWHGKRMPSNQRRRVCWYPVTISGTKH